MDRGRSPVGRLPRSAGRSGYLSSCNGSGAAGAGEFIWPLAGSQARIRGDLGAAGLAALADRVTAVAGRPSMDPPAGYVVTSTGRYREAAVHEAGYGSVAVAEQDALGDGWVHTGLVDGGGFEDALYAAGARAAPAVGGHPAVLAGVREGSALLCWPGAWVAVPARQVFDLGVSGEHRNGPRARCCSRSRRRASGRRCVPAGTSRWRRRGRRRCGARHGGSSCRSVRRTSARPDSARMPTRTSMKVDLKDHFHIEVLRRCYAAVWQLARLRRSRRDGQLLNVLGQLLGMAHGPATYRRGLPIPSCGLQLSGGM